MSPQLSVLDKLRAGAYENKAPYSHDRAVREAWRAEDERIKQQFRQDLAAEHGVTGHPKEPKLFDLAWEHGHASGFNEVSIYYCDFVELLKEDA